MNSILYTVIMTALWILNLFNDSGFGQAYQTTEKAMAIVTVLFLVMIVIDCKRNNFLASKRDLVIFGGMSFIMIVVSCLSGYGKMGIHYISAFMLVYLLGQIKVQYSAIRLTGIVYLFLGMSILCIYNYTSFLSGWNENTIGMIGLYSFLIFLISFYNSRGAKNKAILFIATGVYFVLTLPTESRSSIVFAIIAVLFVLSFLPEKAITATDKRYYFWLLIPLFIAIIVVRISKSSYMNELDLWSLQNFQKPLFNGRNKLWEAGFDVLKKHILFGSGTLSGNWHNCIVTVLAAYGCVGCVFWILSLKRILSKGRYWIDDVVVSGCIITFIIMYIQQSVELGLVNERPNVLPYIVLGIMLGRVKLLNEKEVKGVQGKYEEDKYYSSGI